MSLWGGKAHPRANFELWQRIMLERQDPLPIVHDPPMQWPPARQPIELDEMPTKGKVVVGHPRRRKATWYLAAREQLDFFINDLVPVEAVYVIDVDEAQLSPPNRGFTST